MKLLLLLQTYGKTCIVSLVYIDLHRINISKESASLQFAFASLIILSDVSISKKYPGLGRTEAHDLTLKACGEPFSDAS